MTAIRGWMTSSGGYAVTIAICKVTPSATDPPASTNLVPTVIAEVVVTGQSSNNKLVSLNDPDAITAPGLTAGDIIFPMIKEATAGSNIYMNLTIQTITS